MRKSLQYKDTKFRKTVGSIESDFLNKLKEEKVTRDDIVPLYAQGIYWKEFVDWVKINKAIMDKWSKSGLIYIKHKAWKELDSLSSKKTRKG